MEHVPGTRNQKVMWIFEAEQRVMEETDSEEVQVLISMLGKYIRHLKRELLKNNGYLTLNCTVKKEGI